MKKWLIFIHERFEPVSHLIMIALFLIAHILVARVGVAPLPFFKAVLLFIGVTLFFLKLRFYDEIKDYETDLKFNQSRPLPRGLLTIKDLHQAIALTILFELIIFSLISLKTLLFSLIPILYSLLMYKEFFIGKYLRPHLTTYALTHTIVTIPLSLMIFVATADSLSKPLILIALMSWPLFNIFEFGRKSFLPSEERVSVPSYTNIFGRLGAFLLVLVQAAAVSIILRESALFNYATNTIFGLIFFLLLFIGIFFWGKVYRIFSSVYIVLIYAVITWSLYVTGF